MRILQGKEKDWEHCVEINSHDGYSKTTVDYAIKWAELMENGIKESKENPLTFICNNADALSVEADTDGITGSMYGCAVSILSEMWVYGEELRRWHNLEYNYSGDGVVNPAVIVIK